MTGAGPADERERLEQLAAELDAPVERVVAAAAGTTYLGDAAEEFADAAAAKRSFLKRQLAAFEAVLAADDVAVDVAPYRRALGDELNAALAAAAVPRVESRPFAAERTTGDEAEYDLPAHPHAEVVPVQGGLRYRVTEVDRGAVERLAEALRGSSRGLVRLTNAGHPVVADAGAADPTPTVAEEYTLLTVHEGDPAALCRLVVRHGHGDELLAWLAEHAVTVGKELQYRYGTVDDEHGFEMREGADGDTPDAPEAAADADEPGRVTPSVDRHPAGGDGARTVGVRLEDAETGDHRLDLRTASAPALAALATELLEAALWLEGSSADE